MLIQTQIGIPSQKATGNPTNPGGTFGEALFSELSPQYYTLLKAGKVFSLQTANVATVTAFTGGAAGTPLMGIYNPANSGVDIVLLQSRLSFRTTGTTAGAMGFNFWLATQGSTSPTGTQTVARQMYSGAQSGSASYCMVNTANTAALASTFLMPSFTLGNVTTTGGVNVTQLVEDHRGAITVSPGNYLAWGNYVAMAVAAVDAALVWAEVPA